MSKKESNPIPEGAVKPPPPPAPPPKRIIKEDVDLKWLLGWSEGKCIEIRDQKAVAYGVVLSNEEWLKRFAETMARPILWGYSDEEIDMT